MAKSTEHFVNVHLCSRNVLKCALLVFILIPDFVFALNYEPSTDSIRRYLTFLEQQQQLQARNSQQQRVNPNLNVRPSTQDNQNTEITDDFDSNEQLAKGKDSASDRFAWFQAGQPEVVSNDDYANEYNGRTGPVIVYPPKEDVQDHHDRISPPRISGNYPTSISPSEQKKSEQNSGNRELPSFFAQSRVSAEPMEAKNTNPLSDIYFVVIVAGCSAVAIFAVIAAGYCFYRFQKNSKAAAEVDYPAYGVTGPNKEHSTSPSGDRRLAQSAQMYHYQHQKQQMIAVEKATTVRNTSASDVDSEEENEEGDYTVYECPGLAPTGEMEVKNPLFHDDSTPMSPPVTAKETVRP